MRAKVPCWGENWSRLCPCLGGGGGGCHSPLLDWHQPHQRPVGGHSILFWECFISRNCLRYGTAADVFTVNVYSKNYWTDRAFPDMIVPSDFWSVCLCLCLMRGGEAFHVKLSTRKQVQQHGDANRDLLWDDTEGELCTCCKAEDFCSFAIFFTVFMFWVAVFFLVVMLCRREKNFAGVVLLSFFFFFCGIISERRIFFLTGRCAF